LRPRRAAANWRPSEADALAHATGTPADTIRAMTLAHYDQRAVVIDHAARRVNIRTLWGRGVGSRYCPQCLTESSGRWLLRWRLNWTFACPVHRRLADWCPHCRRDQRTRASGEHEPPRPGFCAHPVDPRTHRPLRGRTGAHVRCHGDLRQAETITLPADHPALHAQQMLAAMFASGSAEFGVYARQPQPALAALADIRSIAGRVAAHILNPEGANGPQLDLAGILPDDPVTTHLVALARAEHQRNPTRAQKRPGTVAPASAADATRHPTFGKAASALGIHIATLIDHINRLEREYGQPLLERLDNRRIMQPTKLGQEVIAAVRAAKQRTRVPPTLSRELRPAE